MGYTSPGGHEGMWASLWILHKEEEVKMLEKISIKHSLDDIFVKSQERDIS